MNKPRRLPQRSCVICRNKTDKRDLVRLVITENGLLIDPSGKVSGRGAYLCKEQSCWQAAGQGKILSQALKSPLSENDLMILRQYRF